MYCVQCGVELQKGIETCPLCGLRVYHPALTEQPEPLPYPRRGEEEAVSHGGLLFIISVLFIITIFNKYYFLVFKRILLRSIIGIH